MIESTVNSEKMLQFQDDSVEQTNVEQTKPNILFIVYQIKINKKNNRV